MQRKRVQCIVMVAMLCLGATKLHAQAVLDRGLLSGDSAIETMTNTQQNQAVAKGGDQYLVAWSDLRGASAGDGSNQSASDVFGIRLDAAGNRIDPVPFVIAGGMGNQRDPQIAWNGEAWLVLFTSQDPVAGYYEDRLRAVRVSAAGIVLDATPIVFPPTEFTPNTIGLQLAGQGGQWMITRCLYHSDGYGTYLAGQRIGSDGTLLDANPILLLDWVYGGTELLGANGEYLAAGPDWNNSTVTKAQRIGPNGQLIGAPFNLPSPNLATSGSEYYVVWIKDYVNLVGSRVSLNGTLLTPNGTPLVTNFSQYTHSTVAHDGTQWWVEWGVSDLLRTIRISNGGTVLDPNGGVLLPVTIGGNVNTAYNTQLVGRTGGGVHLLWYDLRVALGYDTNVFLLPISAANVAGTERALSIGTHSQRTPDLAAGPGGEVALAFVSEAANADRVLLSFLDSAGVPMVGEPIEVATGAALGQVGVAWNGSVYLVAWDDGTTGRVRARRVNGDGSFVDAAPFEVMPGFDPDVEALGSDFLVACARFDTYPQFIYAWMRIVDGATGTFQNNATLIGGGYVSTGPRVRQDGARWIVTYHSHWSHDSSQSDAVYNFVSPDGSFTPALNPSTTSGGAGTPDVAFSGQKYLFVWRNNSLANANNYIAGRVMNADGSFATNNFIIAEAPGRQLRPVVDWDGTNFVVAWDDQRNQDSFFDERTDIYGTHVSEAGVVLEPSGFPIYAGADGDAAAAILSRVDGVSFVASARFLTTPPFDSYRVGVSVIGLRATDVSANSSGGVIAIAPNEPNPFRDQTRIDFTHRAGEPLTFAIYDLSGRELLRVERDGSAETGSWLWNGRDAAGRVVAAGTYFLRMNTGGESVSRRLTKLR